MPDARPDPLSPNLRELSVSLSFIAVATQLSAIRTSVDFHCMIRMNWLLYFSTIYPRFSCENNCTNLCGYFFIILYHTVAAKTKKEIRTVNKKK